MRLPPSRAAVPDVDARTPSTRAAVGGVGDGEVMVRGTPEPSWTTSRTRADAPPHDALLVQHVQAVGPVAGKGPSSLGGIQRARSVLSVAGSEPFTQLLLARLASSSSPQPTSAKVPSAWLAAQCCARRAISVERSNASRGRGVVRHIRSLSARRWRTKSGARGRTDGVEHHRARPRPPSTTRMWPVT